VKGLLDLEGHLTPILESLVTKNNAMLHDASPAAKYSQIAKESLRALFARGGLDSSKPKSSSRDAIPKSVSRALASAGDLNLAMSELHRSISSLCAQLRVLVRSTKKFAFPFYYYFPHPPSSPFLKSN